MQRITAIRMAIKIAQAASERSEDPFKKVGAVALTMDNRVIAVAYNGLLPGKTISWDTVTRDTRLPFMVHAEQNLCSLIKRGEAIKAVVTTCPCPSCLLLLASHGIRIIHFVDQYDRDNSAIEIANFYGIEMIWENEK